MNHEEIQNQNPARQVRGRSALSDLRMPETLLPLAMIPGKVASSKDGRNLTSAAEKRSRTASSPKRSA